MTRTLTTLPHSALYVEATADALVGSTDAGGKPRCPFCEDTISTGDMVCRVRAKDGRAGHFYVHARCWE